MKIAVLGTGVVGKAHAGKLSQLGHEVILGTQDVEKTLKGTGADVTGQTFGDWHKLNGAVKLGTFRQSVAQSDIVIEALKGEIAVETLKQIEEDLKGKILVDISNPLDFSKGMPPSLFVSNTDSLGEQIQRALPGTKVVKTLNTMNAFLQVDPGQLAGGDHDVFICGNDADAKGEVVKLLKGYGWKNILDLGDITCARGLEMLMPFWLRAWQAIGAPMFNYKIVKSK